MNELNMKDNLLKRNVKDIVFHEAFACQENLPAIYKALHPEDKTEYSPEDFIITSTNTIIMNSIRNDLSFWNLKTNKIVFLIVEPNWKKLNMLRYRLNVLDVTSNLIKKYQDSNVVDILKNEIFVLNTGNTGRKQVYYHVFDAINREYVDGYDIGNLLVTVISRRNGNIPVDTIIDTYFKFCEIQKELVDKFGRDRKAARMLVDRCIKENIFKDFFVEHREEVMNNIESMFSQEREYERFGNEKFKDGFDSGFDSGFKDNAKKVYNRALKRGMSETEARELAYGD